MADSVSINGTRISLLKGDLTDLDVESFVFYAKSDLKLGSGFGNAISLRGGMGIQEELNEIGSLEATESVITEAGNLKARYIIHANGPKFQEEDLENKLRRTVRNILKTAEKRGIKQVAMPPLGTGFYGIPLDLSARVMLSAFSDYFNNGSELEEIILCVMDSHELPPFKKQLSVLSEA